MTTFKVSGQPSAGLYECQTCKKIVAYKRIEDKLKKHSKKHDGIVKIEGTNGTTT